MFLKQRSARESTSTKSIRPSQSRETRKSTRNENTNPDPDLVRNHAPDQGRVQLNKKILSQMRAVRLRQGQNHLMKLTKLILFFRRREQTKMTKILARTKNEIT